MNFLFNYILLNPSLWLSYREKRMLNDVLPNTSEFCKKKLIIFAICKFYDFQSTESHLQKLKL